MCLTNHTIGWDNSKIITTNRRYHQRLCLEAWHINSAHAPLNRDDGGLLPDAYLHLVRKKTQLISERMFIGLSSFMNVITFVLTQSALLT